MIFKKAESKAPDLIVGPTFSRYIEPVPFVDSKNTKEYQEKTFEQLLMEESKESKYIDSQTLIPNEMTMKIDTYENSIKTIKKEIKRNKDDMRKLSNMYSEVNDKKEKLELLLSSINEELNKIISYQDKNKKEYLELNHKLEEEKTFLERLKYDRNASEKKSNRMSKSDLKKENNENNFSELDEIEKIKMEWERERQLREEFLKNMS